MNSCASRLPFAPSSHVLKEQEDKVVVQKKKNNESFLQDIKLDLKLQRFFICTVAKINGEGSSGQQN